MNIYLDQKETSGIEIKTILSQFPEISFFMFSNKLGFVSEDIREQTIYLTKIQDRNKWRLVKFNLVTPLPIRRMILNVDEETEFTFPDNYVGSIYSSIITKNINYNGGEKIDLQQLRHKIINSNVVSS